jgi:hypothetical protein
VTKVVRRLEAWSVDDGMPVSVSSVRYEGNQGQGHDWANRRAAQVEAMSANEERELGEVGRRDSKGVRRGKRKRREWSEGGGWSAARP